MKRPDSLPQAAGPQTSARQALAAGFAEFALLMLPSLLFLAAYVLVFHAPSAAVSLHLQIVLPFAASLMLLRAAVLGGLPGPARLGADTLLYAAWFLGWGLYYGIVLIGLQSWGRVATWPLIQVYLLQWQDLLAVLDVPPAAAAAAAALLLALACGVSGWVVRRTGWPRSFRAAVHPALALVLLGLSLAVGAYRLHEVQAALHIGSNEPLLLTVHPWAGAPLAQTNRTQGARALDEREARAAEAYVPGERRHRRNVILIVGDALRADRMPLFGNPRNTSPWLSAMAADDQLSLASRAHAMCAESFCGLMALARSKYLHEFSANNLSLAQVLRRHGYAVYLILGGDHTNFYGLADALGPADLYWDGLQSGQYMNDDRAVIERVRALPEAGETPVFMQFHLMSSHGLGKRHEEFQQFSPVANYYVRSRLAGDPESVQAWARNFYDNGVLQFDHTVRELLAALGDRGYLDDALVVITGDHGELLGERGRYSHADTVLQPVLDVPLILMRRGYSGDVIPPPRLAAQVDIAPTVLVELGLPVPASWSGEALQRGQTRGFSFFMQGFDVGLFDLRDPAALWKYWRNVRTGAEEAYRLDLDPHEQHNLIESVPPALRSTWMRETLPATTAVSGVASSGVDDPASG